MNLVIMVLRLVFMALLLTYLYRMAKELLSYFAAVPRTKPQGSAQGGCFLEVLASGTKDLQVGERVYIGSFPFTIGRREGHSLVVHDPKVSTDHAELYLSKGGIYIRDLNSTNGTSVNGSNIVSQELAPMDKIKMGGLILQLVRCEHEVQ